MKKYDLLKLEENKVESIKENVGLMWHYRLIHLLKSYFEKAAKVVPELRNVKFDNSLLECEVCRNAKQVRFLSTTVQSRFNEPLTLIHSDLMGPINPSIYKYGDTYINNIY